MYELLALLVMICSFLRLLGLTHIAFQAVAHIVVGCLIFGSVVPGRDRRDYRTLLVIFTIIEVVCFLVL